MQLYLSAARQLLAENNFGDAQLVLRLTQEHFHELVNADNTINQAIGQVPTEKHENESNNTLSKDALEIRERKREDESRNLDLLDRLLPI